MVSTRLRATWLVNVTMGTAAVAAGAPVLARPTAALRRINSTGAQRDSIVASDLEVVTVTDRSVVLTWTTRVRDRTGRWRNAPADTEVRLTPADGRGPARVRYLDSNPTPYHYAEIDGLEPGRTYRFEAYSHGHRAVPARTLVTRRAGTPESTGVFATLRPPPGQLVRTIALANDVHYGEHTSGLLVAGLPTGFRHDTGVSYPDTMLGAMLEELRRPDRAADHLIVAGDLTDSGTLEQSQGVRSRLDAWGKLGRDYFVCRGNHESPRRNDHWGTVFHPHQQLTEQDLGGLRLIGLDTTRRFGSGGTVEGHQLRHLRQRLMAEPELPTLVFGHHPVTSAAAVSNPGGPGFVLDRMSAAALQHIYRAAPGVFLQHAGHTHRTRRTRPDTDIDVEFLEVAAVKEYPGGYLLLRIYTGGYMANFYKSRSEPARHWSTRTRRQYFGLQPDHALGSLADRNHVVLRDFSGLTPPTRSLR